MEGNCFPPKALLILFIRPAGYFFSPWETIKKNSNNISVLQYGYVILHSFFLSLQPDDWESATPAITLAELRSHDVTEIARDLSESLKREKKLKSRVQELVVTLEKLSRNAEIRHQQSAEFVNDLKRANR